MKRNKGILLFYFMVILAGLTLFGVLPVKDLCGVTLFMFACYIAAF